MHVDGVESLEFMYETPDALNLKLEAPVDTITFEKFCKPALKCLIAEGIDINGLRHPTAARPHASVHVVLRAPFHQTFSSLAQISETEAHDEGFTRVPIPHSVRGKAWHALEVLAVLTDATFARTIHRYSFQHICDAAVVRFNRLVGFLTCRSLVSCFLLTWIHREPRPGVQKACS